MTALGAALRYEWRRLSTLRSTYWLVGISVFIAAALSTLIGWGFSSVDQIEEGESFVIGAIATQGAAIGAAPLLIAYVMGMFGLFTFGHEYRHGMIRATLTAVPNRGALFAAKILLTTAVTGATALVCTVLGVFIGNAFLPDIDAVSDDVIQVVVGVSIYSALFGPVGLALAALLRNQVGALVLLLLVPLVGELIIRLILILPSAFDDIQDAAGYLPFDAGAQMFTMLDLNQALDIFGYDPQGPVGGGVTFAVFTALMLALAGALFARRDA